MLGVGWGVGQSRFLNLQVSIVSKNMKRLMFLCKQKIKVCHFLCQIQNVSLSIVYNGDIGDVVKMFRSDGNVNVLSHEHLIETYQIHFRYGLFFYVDYCEKNL